MSTWSAASNWAASNWAASNWAASNWAAAVPVQPDRDTARSLANQELARPEYQAARPGPVSRAATWLWHWLSRLNLGVGHGPVVGLVIFGVVVVAVIGFLLYRTGGLRPSVRRRAGQVLSGRHTTAAEHRALADQYAAEQNWDLAVVERFRAIARELEERALLSPQPGRTAVEVARDGGAVLPELAGELLTAARYFDDVSYGHLRLGPDADQTLRHLDDQLRAARSVGVR